MVRRLRRITSWSLTGALLALFVNDVFASSFMVFDATLYKGKPDMQAAGLTPLPLVYESVADPAWSKTDRTNLPSQSSLTKAVKKSAEGSNLVCLDFEAWPLTSTLTSLNEPITKLLTILQWSKQAAPNVKFGFYGVPPIQEYWGPASGPTSEKGKAWLNASAKLAPLADKVDVIFPSLYTFYTDQDQWESFAINQIQQAKKYNKPVYVFLWPQYHDSNFLLGTKYIPRSYWKRQLQVAYKYADGLVIWGGWDFKKPGQAQWDENAEWWQETKAFISTLKTAPNPPNPTVLER